ncbi:MAG: NUDIX domain-containing protein [Propionibacteriaceae bacterium]
MSDTVFTADDLIDVPQAWPIVARVPGPKVPVFSVLSDQVTTPSGETMVRTYLDHPGAVAVLAINDDQQIAVLRQYRHPAGLTMIEPIAGLLDNGDEDPLAAARRELAEEAMLEADEWRVLVDFFGSAGSSTESIRIFAARGLRPCACPTGFLVEDEEADMEQGWATIPDLLDAIFSGRCENGTLISGVLALAAAQHRGGWEQLRAPDALWLARGHQAGRRGISC